MKTSALRAPALALALAATASLSILTAPAALAAERPAASKDHAAPQAQPGRLISLVLLLREPRKLDHDAIAHAASAAAGGRVGEEAIEEKPPYHRVRLKSGSYVISDVAEPYFTKPEEYADVKDEHIREMIGKHRAWIAVDWLGQGEPADVRATYEQIGKMAAQLAGPGTLAIYSPELDRFADFHGPEKAKLAGPDPLSIFSAGAGGETASAPGAPAGVMIADDDPALKHAREDARSRWAEFVQAFNARKPGQYFGVKGPFEESDRREFMWLTVDEIDGQKIHGKLESQPASLKGWKRDQDIHIKVGDVEDWLYTTPAKESIGGFTEKVLADFAKKAPAPAGRPAHPE